MVVKASLTLCAAVLLALCGCGSRSAGPENVLVVMNASSPDGAAIASYYAQKRGIPEKNICKITCPTDEVIKDEVFESDIRAPIKKFMTDAGLKDKIDYIVLTRGIPIKTVQHWGVDSALTCLFDDYTFQARNPYFGSDKPFSHANYGIYLVTRLDGLTASDAKALVDRALAAKPAKGLFLFDTDPAWDSSEGYNQINDAMRRGAKALEAKGWKVELDDDRRFIVRDGLMGYYSWGSNDHDYSDEAYHKLRFEPGSIAETAQSTSAFTLTSNRTLKGKRSYIVDLIAQGATGVKGYVYEPYIEALASPEVLFDRYTSGRNLAESFYAASKFIHWRDIILGDPLCSPYAKQEQPK